MLNELKNGIIKENPLFVQVLGVCPSLATTTSVTNALGMGAAFTIILISSNIIISCLKSFIPSEVRIPCYIVVIASLVTIIEMFMQAFVPDIYSALGIFIPLIVVNCIVLGRAEAFASKTTVWRSLWDGVGMGLGYSLALVLVASCRELLGSGKFLGIPVLGTAYQPIIIMILPAGAFITMGFIFAGLNYYNNRKAGVAHHG